MTMHERTGERQLAYSAWHRPASINRFLSKFDHGKHRIRLIDGGWVEYSDPRQPTVAEKMGMIDIDHIVIDGKHWADRGPVALIETAETFGEAYDKKATILAKIGEMAGLPTFVVLYQLAQNINPGAYQYRDIEWFFVRRYWPARMRKYWQMTPQQYAEWLVLLRQEKGNTFQPPLHNAWPLIDETDIERLCIYDGDYA